ncbi:MAG: Ger(x)C family spore germination C-terminal domain-containing protein, partial [Bacillota bacterium]|nr:Ger(x)C family spore germination C-terminal domain-containing protein [Bacillota bacterium]
MKKSVSFILVVFVSFMFTGCWDRIELEEEAYVIAVGIDKAVGNENMFRLTFQIASTESAAGGGGGGEGGETAGKASEVITISAPDYLTGRDLITTSIARRLNFSHTRAFILGEELAKTSLPYKAMLGTLRGRQFRRYSYVLVSRERAEDFINGNKPKLEAKPHKFYDYMSRRWLDSGLAPVSTISEFAERFELKSSLLLTPYCTTMMRGGNPYGFEANYFPGEVDKEGGNPTEIIGSAVFKEERMIGSMTGEETRLALLLSTYSKAKSMHIAFPDPLMDKKMIIARLDKKGNAKVKVDISGEKPRIDVEVSVNLNLMAIPTKNNYTDDENNR